MTLTKISTAERKQLIQLLKFINRKAPCKQNSYRSTSSATCHKSSACPRGKSRKITIGTYGNTVSKCVTRKPCAKGKVRGSLTGRCHVRKPDNPKSDALDRLIRINIAEPCKSGSVRKKASGRCSTVKKCPAGKVRNLATNRCVAKPSCIKGKQFDPVFWTCK